MQLSDFTREPGARPSGFRVAWATVFALCILSLPLMLVGAASGHALGSVPLGNAASFGALDHSAMTNNLGATVVNGDIGSSTSIDASVTNGTGSKYLAGSSKLANAQASLLTAYGTAAGAAPTKPTITGVNLAGKTLFPGVYNSSSAILISGPIALKLDGNGNSNSVFIFQAGSDMTVDPTSSITLTNGAQACNVFWQVHSAFLKNTGFTFAGTILALTQITLTSDITVNGRVLARNADVTFIHDRVNTPSCAAAPSSPAPSPSRELYCDASGQSYNLVVGQDKQPPYDTLGLVPAYVDPVTGAKSCAFPAAAATTPVATTTTTTTPATTTAPTSTTPTPTAATPKPATAGVAAARKVAVARRAAVAKARRIAIAKAKRVVHAPPQPARHHFGLTG
jgi:hypothetical protein